MGFGISKRNALWLALAAGIISGISIYINKLAITDFSPMAFSFFKNIIVAGMALGIVFGIGKISELKKLRAAQWRNLVAIGILGGGIPFLLFFYGLKLTSAVNAGFMQKTLFIFATIFAFVFLREKIGKKIMLAMLGMLAGIILISGFGFTKFGFGDLLILVGTVMWAAELTLSKRMLESLSPGTVIFGRMFFGAITMLAFLLAVGGLSVSTIAPIFAVQNAFWLAVTAMFLLAYVFALYSALKFRAVSTVTTTLLVGAPITAILGLGRSPLGALQGIGIAVVLCGAIFLFGNEAGALQERKVMQ